MISFILLLRQNSITPILLSRNSYALRLSTIWWSKYISAEMDWPADNRSIIQGVSSFSTTHRQYRPRAILPHVWETNQFLTVYFWQPSSLFFRGFLLTTLLKLVISVAELWYKHCLWFALKNRRAGNHSLFFTSKNYIGRQEPKADIYSLALLHHSISNTIMDLNWVK